jgi:hemolysin activation/secretion protein
VVEGKLSKIRVEDGAKQHFRVGTIALGLEGAPLNIRDLEQALDQANRLASNNATLEMLPGIPRETALSCCTTNLLSLARFGEPG